MTHNPFISHPTNPSKAQQTSNKQSKTILSYPFLSFPSFLPSNQFPFKSNQESNNQNTKPYKQFHSNHPSNSFCHPTKTIHEIKQVPTTNQNHSTKHPSNKQNFYTESHSFISNQYISSKNLPLSIKQFHFTKINWTKWIIMKSKPETKRKLYPEWHQTHS